MPNKHVLRLNKLICCFIVDTWCQCFQDIYNLFISCVECYKYVFCFSRKV